MSAGNPGGGDTGVLEVLSPSSDSGERHPLVGPDCEIGRRGVELAFPDDAAMADRHARLRSLDDGLWLEPLDAAASVWLCIRGSEGRALEPGDQLWVGRQILVAEREGESWQLRHYGPDGYERGCHPVPDGGVFVGRGSSLILDPDDGQLSRRHGQVVPDAEELRFYDRGAHNGSYLRLRQAELLSPGSEFRVGSHAFRYVVPALAEQDPPPDRSATTEPDAAYGLEARPAERATDPSDGDRTVFWRSAPAEEGIGKEPEGDAVGGVQVVIDSAQGQVSVVVEPGWTILEAVQQAGFERGQPLDWECEDGGCGICVVGVVEGAEQIDPPDPHSDEMKTIQITEQVAPDPNRYRLACLARVRGDVRLRRLD